MPSLILLARSVSKSMNNGSADLKNGVLRFDPIFFHFLALFFLISPTTASGMEPVAAEGHIVIPIGSGNWIHNSDLKTTAERQAHWFLDDDGLARLYGPDAKILWDCKNIGLVILAKEERPDEKGALVFLGRIKDRLTLVDVSGGGQAQIAPLDFDLPTSGVSNLTILRRTTNTLPLYQIDFTMMPGGTAGGRLIWLKGDGTSRSIEYRSGWCAGFARAPVALGSASAPGLPGWGEAWQMLDFRTGTMHPIRWQDGTVIEQEDDLWLSAFDFHLLTDKKNRRAALVTVDGHVTEVPLKNSIGDTMVSPAGDLVWFACPEKGSVSALRCTAAGYQLLPTKFLETPGKIHANSDYDPEVQFWPGPTAYQVWASIRRGSLYLLELEASEIRIRQKISAVDDVITVQRLPADRLVLVGSWSGSDSVLGLTSQDSWKKLDTTGGAVWKTDGNYSGKLPMKDGIWIQTQDHNIVIVPSSEGPAELKLLKEHERFVPLRSEGNGFYAPLGWALGDTQSLQVYAVDTDGVRTFSTKTPQLVDSEIVGSDNTVTWVKLQKAGLLRATYQFDTATKSPAITLGPIWFDRFTFTDLIPFADGHSVAIQRPDGVGAPQALILRENPTLTEFDVNFGGERLKATEKNNAREIKSANATLVEAKINWIGRAEAAEVDGELSAVIIDAETGVEIAHGGEKLSASNLDKAITFPLNKAPAGKCRVTLEYKDRLGSALTVRWPKVAFTNPKLWYERKWLISIFAWLAVVLLVLFCRVPTWPTAVKRFGPIILATGASTGQLRLWSTVLDGPLFTGLMGTTVIGIIVLGYVRPRMLRAYASISPFDVLLPFALRWPKFRRRVYAEYADRAERALASQRRGSNDESYAPVPVEMRYDAKKSIETEPVARILELLTADNGADVLISAEGGLGKSALIRAVIAGALTRFKTTGLGPLPIVIDRAGKLEDLVRDSLSGDRLSDKVLSAQFESGDWFVVIDGLAERGFLPQQWVRFSNADGADGIHFLAAARPDLSWEAAFFVRGPSAIVTPLRLDQETVQIFQRVYEPDSSRWLPDQVLSVCRAEGGGYIPILVRLALNVIRAGGGSEPESVCEIYRGALRALALSERPESSSAEEEVAVQSLLDPARELCLATYWENGRRVFSANEPGFGKVIDRLLKANILLASEYSRADRSVARVRFCHDSMQSYLTAEALLGGPKADVESDLLRAAGCELFFVSESASLTSVPSELFQMCVAVLENRGNAKHRLATEMRRWANRWAGGFGADVVRSAMPLNLVSSPPPGTDTNAVLLAAVASCEDSAASVSMLAHLYGKLAPYIWRLSQKDKVTP